MLTDFQTLSCFSVEIWLIADWFDVWSCLYSSSSWRSCVLFFSPTKLNQTSLSSVFPYFFFFYYLSFLFSLSLWTRGTGRYMQGFQGVACRGDSCSVNVRKGMLHHHQGAATRPAEPVILHQNWTELNWNEERRHTSLRQPQTNDRNKRWPLCWNWFSPPHHHPSSFLE